MATQNYSFTTTKATSSLIPSGAPNQATISFEVATDIETNQSFVKWTLKAGGTSGSCYWYGINFKYGTGANWATTYSKYTNLYSKDELQVSAGATIATGSFYVDHNVDGTQQFGLYFEAAAYPNPNSYNLAITGSSSLKMRTAMSNATLQTIPVGFDMPTIPRASTITCTTVEVGRNPTITINSPSPNFTHTLRYKFGSLSGTIVTKTTSKSYSSWSIPTSFLSEIADAKYGEGTMYCDTYSGNNLNGTTSTTFRVNVPSLYGPTIAPSFSDNNTTTSSLTGNDKKFIQYYSNLNYDLGAFTSSGATITKCEITCGDKTASTMRGTLSRIDSNVVNVTVTDSRGYSTTETYYLDMVPYIKLTAKMQLVSMDTNGSGSVSIRGNIFLGGFGIVENNPTISYRWKAETGSWSSWTNVVYNIMNDSYYAEIPFQGLDYRTTYIYEARAVDRLMTVEPEQLIVKCMPVYDWSNDDFQFNVPVTVNGDLIVTGTVTSSNTPGGQSVDDPAADYIVEQGTVSTGSGNSLANWAYRKWNSGIAECWCRKHVSTAVNTAWGNLYVSGALSYTNITWGVSFIDIPVANITIAPNASGAFLIAGGSTSLTNTNTGGYEIARGSALASAGNFYINYYGIGRWK